MNTRNVWQDRRIRPVFKTDGFFVLEGDRRWHGKCCESVGRKEGRPYNQFMKKATETGVTFVELLVTVFLLTTGILGALMFFSNAMFSSQYARDITAATTHVDHLMEEMQSRPSLSNIVLSDWNGWYAQASVATLPYETINVTYTNSAADPLEINVRIDWSSKTRPMSETFVTRMSK